MLSTPVVVFQIAHTHPIPLLWLLLCMLSVAVTSDLNTMAVLVRPDLNEKKKQHSTHGP